MHSSVDIFDGRRKDVFELQDPINAEVLAAGPDANGQKRNARWPAPENMRATELDAVQAPAFADAGWRWVQPLSGVEMIALTRAARLTSSFPLHATSCNGRDFHPDSRLRRHTGVLFEPA